MGLLAIRFIEGGVGPEIKTVENSIEERIKNDICQNQVWLFGLD